MSVRAYRIIKIELAESPSFNLWHDTELIDFMENVGAVGDFRNDDGNGTMEIAVSTLEKTVSDYKWEKEDYRKDAIKADIAWAKKNDKIYVTYDCF